MGPLQGYTVIELAGIGPTPMAGMLLADMGATVICVERSTTRHPAQQKDPSFRGKKSLVLNLKASEGRDTLLTLLAKADVLLEGYRPGVMEKMGLGPDVCLQQTPKLIYGRMTGWGQDGPLANVAGHDINYIALSGALYAIGRQGEAPVPPLNLVGDMGGGGMLLVSGVLAALLEATKSGKGQVVDAAMVEGTAQLMWMFHGFNAMGAWNQKERESNVLDGGAHFYGCYETLDGKYIAVGAIEPQFYAQLLELTGVDPVKYRHQMDTGVWSELKQEFAKVFKSKTQQQWCDVMEGTDVCFSPVLSMTEARLHPHNIARNTYIAVDGYTQAAPAPRFSRTPSQVQHGQHSAGADGETVLADMGFDKQRISELKDNGVLK